MTRPPRLFWFIIALTLLIAAAFAFNISEWLRGGFGWRWEYVAVGDWRTLPLILVAIIYAVGAWAVFKRMPRAVIAWALIGAVLLAVAAAIARDGDALRLFFARTASLVASGEHPSAALIDWAGGEWRDWTAVMAEYGGNVGTSPPGMFMLYALSAALIDAVPGASDALYRHLLVYQCHNYDLLALTPAAWASAWFGILTPVLAALGVFPLWSLTRRAAGETAARFAVLGYALIPGMMAFATSSSTLFPLLALIIFDLLMRALKRGLASRGGVLWLVAAGGVYGAGMFLNFVFLPLAALYGFYTLTHYAFVDRRAGRPLWTPIAVGAIFGAGALIPWVIFFAITGETFFDLLAQSLGYHLQLDRPYAFWVWFHVWDWAVWSGIGWVLVALVGLWRGLKPEHRRIHPPLIGLSLALTVLALTLSGTTRGESGRIWLFLSPFALAAAAETLTRFTAAPHTRRLWGALMGAHVALALALGLFIEAYPAPDLPPPPAPPQVSVSQPIDALFTDRASGARFRLTGWDAAQNGENITLSLQWEGVQRPLEAYFFGATLVSPDGQTYPVEAWQPGLEGARRYPTTCWDAGVIVGDTLPIALPVNAAAGDWWLSLAAFGDDTHPEGRLAVSTAQGEDVQIGLGPIRIR